VPVGSTLLASMSPVSHTGMEEIHVKSPFFAELCWKMDVLLTPGSLDVLNSIPSLSVCIFSFVDHSMLTLISNRGT
jgi:hypothetical protein